MSGRAFLGGSLLVQFKLDFRQVASKGAESMATATLENELDTIGYTAGMIWHFLGDNGPTTMTQLVKAIDAPRDKVMQGVGWLAREGKICFEEGSRSKTIRLV